MFQILAEAQMKLQCPDFNVFHLDYLDCWHIFISIFKLFGTEMNFQFSNFLEIRICFLIIDNFHDVFIFIPWEGEAEFGN